MCNVITRCYIEICFCMQMENGDIFAYIGIFVCIKLKFVLNIKLNFIQRYMCLYDTRDIHFSIFHLRRKIHVLYRVSFMETCQKKFFSNSTGNSFCIENESLRDLFRFGKLVRLDDALAVLMHFLYLKENIQIYFLFSIYLNRTISI